MEHLIIQAITNNIILYEKTVTISTVTLQFLLNIGKDYITINQDYWRCIYNNTIFNISIKEMPNTIINTIEVPQIVLEQLIRIIYE